MAEKLSVQIALEGGAEIERQLADIGAAGQKAFADIIKSADQAGGFRQLDPKDVTAKLKELGTVGPEAIDKITAAVTSARRLETVSSAVQGIENRFSNLRPNILAVGQAFANLFRASDKAGDAFKTVGVRASEARAGVAALAQGLNAMGAGPAGRAATAIANIGTRFGAIVAPVAVVAGITVALSKFANAAEETNKVLTELQKASGQSFENLSSLQIVFAQGGTSVKTFAAELGNLQKNIAAANDGGSALAESLDRVKQASLSVEEAELSLAEAQLKAKSSTGQLTEAEQKRFDKQRRRLALEEAQARLARAQQQQLEAEANNLDDLVRQFENLSGGIKETFDPLTTLESKVKAITTLLAKVPAEDQFAKLADIFKNLSLIERAQVGKALGLSPETIETLSRGGQALRDMQAEVERLGLSLVELDNIDLEKLRSSQSNLAALWDALKDKMGAAASPAFTSFWEGLTARIKELIPQFLTLATAFGKIDFSKVGAAVADLALKLASFAVQFARMLQAAAEGDTSGFTSLFQNLGDAIMQGVMSLANTVGTFFADAVLESIKNAWANFSIDKEMAKFVDSVLKNWEILKQKLGFSSLLDEGQLTELGTKAGVAFGKGVARGITSVKLPTAAELLPNILEEFRKFGESVAQNWEILKRKLRGGLISPAGAAEAGGGQLGGMDFGPMIAAAEVAAVRIKQIFADAFSQSITLDFSGIITAAQTAATDIGTAFSQIDIASALSAQIDALIAKFNELARAAAAAAAAAAAGSGGGGGPAPAPFARGGLFGGRGTGTSDSNLAWVSRGEHIMPARTVGQPGVLAFLEALRRSGGNLRGVLDGMGRFALGGMVPRVMPAFASGGAVGGMSHVTIAFPGLPAIGGLRASSAVVEELHRAAALAQVRSGGRKPSRYS